MGIFLLRFSNLTNDLGQFSSELGECVLGGNFGTGGERPGPGLGSTSFFFFLRFIFLLGRGRWMKGWKKDWRFFFEFCCCCYCC